jgi:hypothetical protein
VALARFAWSRFIRIKKKCAIVFFNAEGLAVSFDFFPVSAAENPHGEIVKVWQQAPGNWCAWGVALHAFKKGAVCFCSGDFMAGRVAVGLIGEVVIVAALAKREVGGACAAVAPDLAPKLFCVSLDHVKAHEKARPKIRPGLGGAALD